VDVFELMRVGDVMDRNPPTIGDTATVAELSDRIAAGDPAVSRRQATLIVNADGELAGIITRGDVMNVLQRGDASKTSVTAAGSTDLAVTYPDETLHDAIDRMLKRDIGRMPVVNRAQPDRVIGYIGRADVLAARLRRQEEDEKRERGPILGGRRLKQL
jgi:CIC family chloride channel protein